MGAFGDALQRFGTKAERNMSAVFVATVVELRDSVKYGSSVTGAPALPVAPNDSRAPARSATRSPSPTPTRTRR
jgi:hypothetical protein